MVQVLESLIRDSEGRLITGICRKYWKIFCDCSETLALRDGLNLAWQNGINNIDVEIDAPHAIHLLNDSGIIRYLLFPFDFFFIAGQF